MYNNACSLLLLYNLRELEQKEGSHANGAKKFLSRVRVAAAAAHINLAFYL